MTRPQRPCLECGTPCRGPRCPKHTTLRFNASDPAWRALRAQRLNLDEHRCQLAHPGCTIHANTVHLAPELRGDHTRATIDNTLSACRHCHGVEDAPRARGYPATSRR